MKYKNFNVPDEEIDKLVNALGISIVEACEMWLSDRDLIEDETVEELTAKAQKNRITNTIHDAKGEKKPRERKENPLKKEIIGRIYDLFEREYGNLMKVFIRNNEKYIDLEIKGRSFTINLVEHRPKKG